LPVRIWTLHFNEAGKGTPLVLLHELHRVVNVKGSQVVLINEKEMSNWSILTGLCKYEVQNFILERKVRWKIVIII
jgi:hypothetical protein